jgi:hypothetical protein
MVRQTASSPRAMCFCGSQTHLLPNGVKKLLRCAVLRLFLSVSLGIPDVYIQEDPSTITLAHGLNTEAFQAAPYA